MQLSIKQIDKYKYISFDIFETLIKRNVEKPRDIFRLVQLQAQNTLNEDITDFSEQRVAAERLAYAVTDKEEVTLDEIYGQLVQRYSVELLVRLKKIEIELEYQLCVANLDVLDIYQYCVEKKKKILIVSDMYLSQELLSKILRKNGFDKYERMYVSSQVGVQKLSGNLFRYILSDLKIDKRQLLHIGDNKNSDFFQPRRLGINSILISKHVNHLNYYYKNNLKGMDLFSYQTVSTIVNNGITKDHSLYWGLGYETLGPLLYGFSKWLLEELQRKKIRKVFFLSRDGRIMQRAFELLDKKDIKATYFYASRRALIVPLLWTHPELNDVVAAMFLGKRISVKNFIEKVGLNAELYVEKLSHCGLELATMLYVDALMNNEAFLEFYAALKTDIINNSQCEYTLLREYLKQIGFEGQVAIVDIGWNGNMQKALCELIKNENKATQIVGYYVGVIPKMQNLNNDRYEMHGFLFENGKNEELYHVEHCFNSIFETFFVAQHGSVQKYENTECGIMPILYPYEYLNTDADSINETVIVSEIQRGAIDFVRSFSKNKISELLSVSPFCAFQNMQRLGTRPHKRESLLFGNFRFYDTSVSYIAKPQNWEYYIFHPRRLFSDLLNSPWRIGFLRRLLKLQLPYYQFYMVMRKLLLGSK